MFLVASGLLSMPSQLYKSSGTEELLYLVCSGDGILKTDHGFLVVSMAFFPNSEFLGLSPSVERSNVRNVPSFVVVFHVLHVLVYQPRRCL